MKKVISIPTLPLQAIKHLIARSHHPEALKRSLSLSSSSSTVITDQAYALFLKSGHGLTAHLATSLITHFSKSGDFRRSLRFLLDAMDPDSIAFTALLSGYAQFHQTSSAFALYSRLLCTGLRPSEYTLSSLVKSCQVEDDIVVAHGACIRFGFSSNGFLVSGLVQKYARCGRLDSAWKCYNECSLVDDVVCTAMINACVWNGDFVICREVFAGMRRLGLELNEFSITSFLGALWEDVKEGEQIHGISLKMGLLGGSSVHLSNALMSMYCRFGSKLDACKVFDEITKPDVVSWTVRIGASLNDMEAFGVFRTMHSNCVEINELTMVNVFSAVEDPTLLETAKQVHSLCHKMGFLMVTSVINTLISMYGKCREMGGASLVFDELVFRDCVSWNSLISGYSQNGLISSAIDTFLNMGKHYVYPDKYTLASILGALSSSNFSPIVRQIHSYIEKCGLKSDDSVFSALVTAYGKCNSLDGAMKLFDDVTEMNVGIFHVMMASTILDGGSSSDALVLFKRTQSSSLEMEMDGVSYSLALKACTNLTNLGQGKAVHCLALKSGFGGSSFFQSALVDVYCKCGNIADAEEAFTSVSKDNLAAWNAMINGYAQHSHHHKALELFKCMTELGIKPDEITYLGILNSCCHAGLLIEASTHLRSMFELHGVIPCLEHFSCVIDLLGRFGLLEEAKKTIDQMPMSPDAHVWQSLLSACNTFNDLDLGRIAATELLKLQPENDSAYVLLLSLYAKAGKWDDVGRLRKVMKEKNICKEPGFSWTEIEGSTFYFLAEDTSHPDAVDIYSNLKSLSKQMLRPEEDEFYFADV